MRIRLMALALLALAPTASLAQTVGQADAFKAAYAEPVSGSSWTASVHVGIRHKQGIGIAARVASDTVIAGLPTKEACLAAGRMVAAQKTQGDTVYEADGSVLCLDLTTGDTAYEAVLRD